MKRRMPKESDKGAICKEDVVGPFAMRMPEASDKGSQPYRNAFGCFEMAGKDEPHTKPCL